MRPLEIYQRAAIEIKAEKKQEYKLVGSLRMKTGCKLYSWCPNTETMLEVSVKKTNTASYTGEEVENSKAQFNPEFVYFQAINSRNAKRKLDKWKRGDYTVQENFDNTDEPMKLAY